MPQLDLERIECLIFDLDGTLLDSEILSLQSYCDTVPDLDWDVHYLATHLRGHQFARIVEAIEGRIGRKLPDDYESQFRGRMAELFEEELQAYPHVAEAMEALSLPKCIASSGPLKKIRHGLTLTGLLHHFDPHLYSAYDVNSWKPSPVLFLHTAREMGFAPENCLVIEDSLVGIQAAQAAGMQYLLHCPDGANPIADYDGAILNSYKDFPIR